MANVLNLQADAVELTQETKKSHKSYWGSSDHRRSRWSYFYCVWL